MLLRCLFFILEELTDEGDAARKKCKLCILWRCFFPARECEMCVVFFLSMSFVRRIWFGWQQRALLQIGRSFIGNNLNSRHFVDTKFIKLMASNQFNGVSNGVSFHFVNKCGPFCAYNARLSEKRHSHASRNPISKWANAINQWIDSMKQICVASFAMCAQYRAHFPPNQLRMDAVVIDERHTTYYISRKINEQCCPLNGGSQFDIGFHCAPQRSSVPNWED